MVSGKWLLLRRLRKTIQKVKFLLIFIVQEWRHVAPLIGSPSRRQLSFTDPPGLLDCIPNTTVDGKEIGRSPSPASDADDINRRADIFIANFYRHIQMERQVSLQLRYAKGNDGLERTPSEMALEDEEMEIQLFMRGPSPVEVKQKD